MELREPVEIPWTEGSASRPSETGTMSVRVNDGQFDYPKIMFFDPGGTKTINVEPGTAVYV